MREYGTPGRLPTLVDAPYAGHTAMIADYHKGQSLVETLLANGIGHVALTDWKSATADMKDLEIDNYLAEMSSRSTISAAASISSDFARAVGWRRWWRRDFPTRSIRWCWQARPSTPTRATANQAHGHRPLCRSMRNWSVSGRPDDGGIHAAGLENMHPDLNYVLGPYRSLRAYRRPGLSRQEGDVESWYENPSTCRADGHPGDQPLFKENRLAKGDQVSAAPWTYAILPARPTFSLAPPTSRRPSKFSTRQNTSGHQAAKIVKETVPGGHSGCSWARARWRNIGRDRPLDRRPVGAISPRPIRSARGPRFRSARVNGCI